MSSILLKYSKPQYWLRQFRNIKECDYETRKEFYSECFRYFYKDFIGELYEERKKYIKGIVRSFKKGKTRKKRLEYYREYARKRAEERKRQLADFYRRLDKVQARLKKNKRTFIAGQRFYTLDYVLKKLGLQTRNQNAFIRLFRKYIKPKYKLKQGYLLNRWLFDDRDIRLIKRAYARYKKNRKNVFEIIMKLKVLWDLEDVADV